MFLVMQIAPERRGQKTKKWGQVFQYRIQSNLTRHTAEQKAGEIHVSSHS
jgi:hypothetical protein